MTQEEMKTWLHGLENGAVSKESAVLTDLSVMVIEDRNAQVYYKQDGESQRAVIQPSDPLYSEKLKAILILATARTKSGDPFPVKMTFQLVDDGETMANAIETILITNPDRTNTNGNRETASYAIGYEGNPNAVLILSSFGASSYQIVQNNDDPNEQSYFSHVFLSIFATNRVNLTFQSRKSDTSSDPDIVTGIIYPINSMNKMLQKA